jgi:hypothetical protein
MANKRAKTTEQRRAMVEVILAAWQKYPEQRFGQFIDNCLPPPWIPRSQTQHRELFYVEDTDLVDMIADFVASSAKKHGK